MADWPRDRGRGGGATPILISPRQRLVLVVIGLALLALLLRAAPVIPQIVLGGIFIALLISFPVHALSRAMPRGLAILLTLLLLVGLVTIALVYLLPILITQLSGLIGAIPGIAARADELLRDLLRPVQDWGLMPGNQNPDALADSLGQELFVRAQAFAQGLLIGLAGVLAGALNIAIRFFGMLFVAVYLLLDLRKIKAGYLRLAPARYRRDARELWETFATSLSRYLGGLLVVLVAQGAASALALWALGVPYALLLGAWVSVTAIIPVLGTYLGGVPAVVLAFTVSPTTALLTVVAYTIIQQVESNLLTPRVMGQAIRAHPVIILLAVLGAGQVAGLAGAIFAVPTLVVLRVLFDFFRVRVRVRA